MEYIKISGSIKIDAQARALCKQLFFVEFEDDGGMIIKVKDGLLTIQAEGLVCGGSANLILEVLNQVRSFVSVDSYISIAREAWHMEINLHRSVANNQVIPLALAS